MNKKLVLLGAAMLMTAGVASAQKRVTGRVLDSDGQPLIGATIRVEGVKKVTMTDENGNFTLTDVPASAKTLQVSYIGYQAQNVSIASNVKIVMKDNNILDEAVVIGYGTARKIGTVVGSVSKVNGEKISAVPSSNISEAMQGQVAGLQVLSNTGDAGAINSTSMNIRGIGSLSASSEPLVVVDGSPVDGSIMGLMNSGDVESITTLKDASATSIYGSRAANGVIFITTKKGRRGMENAQVTISQKVGWSQLARRIGNPMNATEYLDFGLENGFISGEQYAEYKGHGANTNWQDFYFRNDAPMYQTDFSVRGGNQKAAYFVSGSYLSNTGVDDESHMKRYNLRANIEAQANDWLKFGLNQNIIYTDRESNGFTRQGSGNSRSFSSAAVMFPAFWDPNDPEAKAKHEVLYMGSYETRWLLSVQPSTINDIIYNGSAYLQLTPFKGMTLKSQLGAYATNTNATSHILTDFPGLNGLAETNRSDYRDAQWTITNTAEYRFNIGKDHDFTLLAGQEGIKYSSNSFAAHAKGSTDDRLLQFGNMTEANINDLSQSSSAYQFLSFFGRADYSLKNKYFANFTVRNDRSSRFGKTNRSAMFYSGGVMWDMKSENFMKDAYWLDDLDVRVSVGSTGNASIGDYTSLGLVGSTQYDGNMGWGLSQPSNTELGWEKQIQTNFGFTAAIFNRFNFEFNAYNRKTKDMLMTIPLPFTTGFSTQMVNVGEMSNRGVELSASYDVIKRKDLRVNIRANYAYNTNKIDKLFYGLDEWPMESYLLCYKVGESLNYYMPIYAGVDQNTGEPMWYKKGHKGKPGHTFNPETMTKDASNMDALNQDTGKKRFAPHTGGFGVSASWKGLTLSTDFSFVLGKYMVNNTYLWATSKPNIINGNNADRDMLNIWKKPGDKTSLPAFQYESQFDTHLLENSSFLRLKNLTLAYDLPSKWMKATNFMTGARLSFTGRNLFTVTKFKGADPEIDTNISYGGYPATRQFVLGVEVNF